MTNIDFKQVYQTPFHSDGLVYVFSMNDTVTFTILTEDKDLVNRVIAKLNGESDEKFEGVGYSDQGHIAVNKEIIFLTRGWGKLIGGGGYHLPADEAKKIQDDFIMWCVNKLKE